ncbi:MAG: amidohydrolase [Lachnospiraceae bacterium]|nr:amidohydrolase [Lachnospiraceae bacterium]
MIRFYNAQILTMNPAEQDGGLSIFLGEVHVENDRICKVIKGAFAPGEKETFEREIDCEDNLLLPGFKNAHTHSAMTFLRSNADDLPLQEWLNNQVFPYEAKLTGDDIYTLTKLAILEYLSGGTTAVMEMYLNPDRTADAFIDAGMRVVQTSAINNFNDSVEKLEDWYLRLNGKNPLSSFRLGFHAEYTTSVEMIREIAALAAKYEAPVYTHIAETKTEVDECIARYGKTPVALLCDEGIFRYGGAGYHLVHTTEDDRKRMKEHGVSVVTNPASNLKLASGIAPVADYLKDGIAVAIGTDGPASNNCLDMFREMFLVTALGKYRENDASAIPADAVLKMALSDGADIIGLPEANCLAEGKFADLFLLDIRQPNMQPVNNLLKNIVYSGSKSNVILTMVGGKILYERNNDIDRAFHIDCKPSDLYEEAEKIRRRILG